MFDGTVKALNAYLFGISMTLALIAKNVNGVRAISRILFARNEHNIVSIGTESRDFKVPLTKLTLVCR